jgi:hypothetical protein
MTNEDNILDWDQLSTEDQNRAEELLRELNQLFNKYEPKEEKPCEDSIWNE